MCDTTHSHVSVIGLFPFQINTMLGDAAVKYGEVFDPDKMGHTRTGLFAADAWTSQVPAARGPTR